MAGTIDSLNFEVILNDKTFNEAIKRDLKMAKDLNMQLTAILNLKKKLNTETTQQIVNAEKVRQAEQKTQQEVTKTAIQQQKLKQEVEKTKAAQDRYGASVLTTRNYLSSSATIMRTLSQLTGVAFSVIGLRRFLSTLIDITGQFEVQRMALRNMLQDVDGADKIFQDLYQFSSDSTYRFSELAKYAKQLAAFDIGKDNLLETTKMLGDVASGVGVSMDRLILAYGHVKSSGFLRGIQLRSFSQNGVPILEELSKMFTEIEGKVVSLGDVFDRMTKRQIPFEMVEEAFRRMTSEGGKFYQMQEVLAKTLAGQINILKGRWENLLAAIGQANDGVLKNTVAWMSNLVSSTENVGRLLKQLAVGFGAYEVGVALAVVVTKGFGAALLEVGIALESFYLKLMNNPYAIIGAAVAATAVAIYQYSTALSDAEKITDTATRGIGKYQSALAAEQAELDRLYAKLNLAKEGTEEYDRVKNDIYNRFGPYIQELYDEGVAVDNLADIYDNLTTKVQASLQARFLESESSAVLKQFDTAVNNIYESFKKTAERANWSIADQEDIWRYISTGELKNKDLESQLSVSGGGTIGLPGTFLYRDFGMSPDALRSLMIDAKGSYDEAKQALDDVLKTEAEDGANDAKETEKELNGWRKAVSDITKTLDQETLKATGLAMKDTEEYYEYLERIGKKSQELNKERDLALKADKGKYDEYLKAINLVDKALEGNILKDARYTKTPWRGSSSKDPNKDAISSLKTQISLLERYLSIFRDLTSIKGENGAAEWMAQMFGGDKSRYLNIESEITTLIEKLRGYGDEGRMAAYQEEARLGVGRVKQLKAEAKAAEEAQKAVDKYIDALEKYTQKDRELSGTGAAFKVSKAIADYKSALNKNTGDFRDVSKLAGALPDSVSRSKAYLDLYGQWAQNRIAAMAALRQSVSEMADDIFKEKMEGYDLTNWNDKTLAQILDIKRAVESMEIPDEIKAMLEDYPELLAILEQELNRLKQEKVDKTIDPERFKKIATYAKRVSGYFSKAAGALRDLAEATGNTKLGETAEAFGMIAQNMQAAADGAEAWGGWWGAIIGGVTDIIDQMTTGFTEAIKKANELANTVREIKDDAWIASNKTLFSNDSIFGDASFNNVQGAAEAMRNIRKDMEAIGDPEITRSGTTFWEKLSLGWRIMHNPEHIAPEEYIMQGGLREVMQRYGLNVYDKYGNLDPASIRKVIEMFGDESGVLERLAKDAEAYADAMKTVESAMESVFGDIASSAADNIIDQWIEMGSAALDYADILDDVARRYAKMLIESSILDKVLNKEEADRVADMFINGRADDAMAAIAGDMEQIAAMEPVFAQILSAFDPYFRRGSGASGSGSLGNGIKSITEDTANLLASYLNAIRADVSYIRLLQEKGWSSVSAMGAFIPNLDDYLAQVAAANYDIAQSNAAILSELRSVIGAPGTSGSVVRVERYS